MAILIDGYNVLHVVGILGRGTGPGSLERARLAMLNFLAESLPAADVARTTVVFDAHDSPRGLPVAMTHRGLNVRFAVRYEDADSLIEELIQADSAPRRLVVVSSDHRLQRAARRRRARAVDSDVWFAEVVRARQQRQQAGAAAERRPAVPLLEEDVNYWLRQFGGQALVDQMAAEQQATERQQPIEPNPFPPGYAEDVEE
jgi:predicted RNA-binding protein with PIN domain